MLMIFLSWCWIGISAFLWGFAGLHLFGRINGYRKKDTSLVLVFGLCLLTVYAQFFSLFYKVGAAANMSLLLVDIGVLVVWHKEIAKEIQGWFQDKGIKYKLGILLILGLLLLIQSSGAVIQYDTYLYHAQSIHWIEDYGVVEGLGNLHNRLAYNSSIFSLEALFSLRFLIGQSLHSVNGFVVFLMLGYAICSMKCFREQKFFASDFLRLALLFYYNYEESYIVISSSGSDLFALGLVVYIFVKWVSYLEDGETETAPYAYLSVLGVYAVSVKLSAAMVVLLAVMPAITLISHKKWKETGVYLAAGILVIAPFLIRNVLISGYLVYPYPELDLFSFDWKMPAYTLTYDRNEIKAWGWGLNDVNRFATPMAEWFPIWIANLTGTMRTLFYLNLIAGAAAVAEGIRRGVKQKKWDGFWIVLTMAASFLLWFLGSPLPRYGSVYMTLLPLFVFGTAAAAAKFGKTGKNAVPAVVLSVAMIALMYPMVSSVLADNADYPVACADYMEYPASAYPLGDEVIYVPDAGDRAGYYAFPSTPYVNRLNLIELRGNEIKDGFRMKEEYRNAYVSTYGEVSETNMFEEKR